MNDAMARRWLVGAVEHLGVEIDLARPLDRSALGVYAGLLEKLALVSDRLEDAAAGEQLPEADLLDRAVAERRSDSIPLQGLTSVTKTISLIAVARLAWVFRMSPRVPSSLRTHRGAARSIL